MENKQPLIQVNTRKVIGRMAELGYSKSQFAEALGISRGTLSHYLKEPERMPYSIISQMVDLLCNESIADARWMFMDLAREVQR